MDVMFALFGVNLGWKAMRIICWVLIVLGTVMLATPFIFHGFTLESWREIFRNFFVILVPLWFGISGNVLIPIYSRRISRARAALADPTAAPYRADVQPASGTSSLSVPMTIDLAARRKVALGWAIAIYAVIAFIFLLAQVIATSLALDGYISLMFALCSALYILAAGVLVAQPPHQTIRITEAGLTVRSMESRTIAWDKARVFALAEGSKRPGSTAIYLLSSGRNSVRWSFRPHTRWYSVTTPTTSDEEYQRQMEALLSYIAARTNLLLLDLR